MAMMLFFLLITCSFSIVYGSEEVKEYHDIMKTKVVPAYRIAYNTLYENIIEEIFKFNGSEIGSNLWITEIEDDTNAQILLRTFVKKLTVAAASVYNNLKKASTESQMLQDLLYKEITSTTVRISEQEELTRQLDTTIDELTVHTEILKLQVSFAEQYMRAREIAVQNAERYLSETKHIGKRSLGAAGYGVVHSLIERRKKRIKVAEIELKRAREKMTNRKQELEEKQRAFLEAGKQHTSLNQRQQKLLMELNEVQNRYAAISSFTNKLIHICTHMKTVVGSSKILASELKYLIDFELVIDPLNNLTRQMIEHRQMSSFGFEILSSTIATVNTILDQINKKFNSFSV